METTIKNKLAREAFTRYATPKLKSMYNNAIVDGHILGDHPLMVDLFYRIGKDLSEDKFFDDALALLKSRRKKTKPKK